MLIEWRVSDIFTLSSNNIFGLFLGLSTIIELSQKGLLASFIPNARFKFIFCVLFLFVDIFISFFLLKPMNFL